MVPEHTCRVWWSTDLRDGDCSDVGRPCAPTVPLPSDWITCGGLQGSKSSPYALYWMDQGWWTDTAVCTSSEESSGLYPHGQTEHCLSNSDTVVYSISLIILLLTGYNPCLCFYFSSLHFHLVLFIICESANVYVSASVFQSKYCNWQKRGRQTNVLKSTGIWIHHTPTHTYIHNTGLNHCTVCGIELYASHKTSAGFSFHLHADKLYNVLVTYSLLIRRTRLGKLLQKNQNLFSWIDQ